jgi:O-glycosyl hydrolase
VLNLSHVDKLIAGHGYWTNTPLDFLKSMRENLRDTLKKFGVKFWMTEQCIMGNDEEIGGGHKFDTTMKTAIYVARCIHHDMVYANASSWQWWRAIGEDYKDGLLEDFGEETIKTGKLYESRLLWTLGNYSRFIRPGAVRISSTLSAGDNPTSLMSSSYKNADGNIVTVLINYSDKEEVIKIKGTTPKKMYITSDAPGCKLRPMDLSGDVVAIPARSVVTIL